jgi:hypothetical protein
MGKGNAIKSATARARADDNAPKAGGGGAQGKAARVGGQVKQVRARALIYCERERVRRGRAARGLARAARAAAGGEQRGRARGAAASAGCGCGRRGPLRGGPLGFVRRARGAEARPLRGPAA